MTATVIYTYILVYWYEVPCVDVTSRTSAASKEGTLLVGTAASFRSPATWRAFYFILKYTHLTLHFN